MENWLDDPCLSQLYAPVLLTSESADDHHLLRNSLQRQIQPHSFVEHLWVADLVHGEHEIKGYGEPKHRSSSSVPRKRSETCSTSQCDRFAIEWTS
jgi:hypothetical protein